MNELPDLKFVAYIRLRRELYTNVVYSRCTFNELWDNAIKFVVNHERYLPQTIFYVFTPFESLCNLIWSRPKKKLNCHIIRSESPLHNSHINSIVKKMDKFVQNAELINNRFALKFITIKSTLFNTV